MHLFLAVFFTGIIGIAGLAVDYGFATLERRVLQNAADAAAQSAAIDMVRGDNPVADATTIARRNGAAITATIDCQYVDSSDTVTGSCAAAPSGTSSGVKVTATNTRPTFLMRALGIPTITVSADSTARVSAWTSDTPYEAGNGLFIVCGFNTKLAGPGNRTMNILQGSGPYYDVNAAAVGQEFVIHDPNVADCGMHSSSFKGLNASAGTFTLPRNLITETGTRAGPTRTAVAGIQGCAANLYSDNVNDCVMLIPVFDIAPAKEVAHAVRWLPFHVRQVDSNTHYGTLLSNYTVRQDTGTILAPWTKNTKASITSVRTVR